MRDISDKIKTLRIATARAVLTLSPATLELIRRDGIPKGNPLPVARVAAIQAAKNTSQIIPLCHPLPIDHVEVEFEQNENSIAATVTVKAIYKTGVEMEALTGASVAALTLYDMLKPVDDSLEITGVTLLKKKGGKSDYAEAFRRTPHAAVLVISDSIAAGKKEDTAGKMICERLEEEGVELADYTVISDEREEIERKLIHYADEDKLDFVLTTGGTGFSPRDVTPEAMRNVIEREIPGIPETARQYGQERTPYAMLSRGRAGLRGQTVIVNLPGSRGGVRDTLAVLFPSLLHSLKIVKGGGHPKTDDRPEVKRK